ncbi:MAG: glycosyltransferase family 2 protein [Sedimentisphaerales bacterium]|nr:glycosyltransferase family 2 protein [Sedimentisphaerales bacterium]
MTPEISIIIVTYNRCDLLINCLSSIFENPPSRSFEIIIVDNASTDNSVRMVEQNYKNIKLIKNRTNKGFAPANNQALKIAAGKFILFLNSDTTVTKNSIDNLAEFLEKTPGTALCTPKLINPDGSVQPNVYSFNTFRSVLATYTIFKYLHLFKKSRSIYKMRDFKYDSIIQIDRPMGAAMMAKKNALEKVGNFDENFFFFFEEVDLCFRLKKAGFEIYFVPNSQITHIGRASSKTLPEYKTDMMFYESMFYYFRKHRGQFNTFLFSLIFKPATLLYYLTKTITNFTMALFTFFRDKQKLDKAKENFLFLCKCSLKLLAC